MLFLTALFCMNSGMEIFSIGKWLIWWIKGKKERQR
jgi:hypothetical protein